MDFGWLSPPTVPERPKADEIRKEPCRDARQQHVLELLGIRIAAHGVVIGMIIRSYGYETTAVAQSPPPQVPPPSASFSVSAGHESTSPHTVVGGVAVGVARAQVHVAAHAAKQTQLHVSHTPSGTHECGTTA